MATIKTLLGNVKGKDGRGYEEVILYDGNCSACISSDTITASSPMIKLSDSIEKYKSIRIEFISFDGKKNNEGSVSTTITFSVNYIKNNYTFSCIKAFSGDGANCHSTQGYGFYDDTHLTLCWENYSGWAHNISHITVTGIRDRVSDAEKNFNKYSTTEEVIGTWIDGKPIYRKVVILSSNETIANRGTTISHAIHYIDCPINCKAIDPRGATTDAFWANEKNSTSGVFYCAEGFEGNTLIFEYTKTTD